ncbi:CDP-glycerol glycerophosphotransferase family protein [Leucobacter sp. cx-328]|uniref:bifunctional glycosyltransferase/CDP-glycerol:glycerophosphate glycerophosphotransferase n=1 Tax=unclassified Leucobacter TaxID=2621730 RepID=UPI00165E7793|nr:MULTISPECIES: CDP-glycerol glycerophosphotransferase family protein [unclassified Leucobacter]MBC9944632.1 CDP-glycerol glycerophosphotransferase family protein [Leucobacter sp. cx-328]
MKLLTVVIPAYNAERYLDDCLASVLDQGIPEADLEIIVINDGSTDSTLITAQRWADAHPSIHVHDQPSHGIAYNRNLALELATSEYFAFLDADDIVARGSYRRLVDALIESGSDFITSPVYRFTDWQKQAWIFTRNADLFDAPATGLRFADEPQYVRDFMVWNKVFRKSFLDQSEVRFPEGMIYEDVAVMPRLFLAAERFDVYSDPVVFWRITDGSITQTLRPAKALDRLQVLAELREFFLSNDADEALIDEFDFAVLDYNLRWLYQEFCRYDDATQLEILSQSGELVKPIRETVVQRVPEPLRTWVHLSREGHNRELTKILENAPKLVNLRVDATPDDVRNGEADERRKALMVRRAEIRHKWLRRVRNVCIYLVFRPIVLLIPIDQRRVFVANYWGNKFSLSDGPAALAVRIAQERPDMKITVLSTKHNKRQIHSSVQALMGSAARVSVVKNHSFRYFYHLWRAKYLFNDVNFSIGFNVDRFVEKRPGQIEIQTTHGTPLKKMGVDSEAAISVEEMPKFLAKSKRYDYLVAPSPMVGKIFADSHAVSPKLLQTGLPQNDRLFEPITSDEVAAIKAKYDIDPTRKLLVYAPTYRYRGGTAFPYAIDFARLKAEFGDEYQIVIKTHPFTHTRLDGLYFRELTDHALTISGKPFIKLFGELREEKPRVPVYFNSDKLDITMLKHETPADINELMRAADVLVTDYSSILFNFPHLDKPLIAFAPDAELYESSRGMYFSLKDIVPGAFTQTTEELIAAVQKAGSPDEWDAAYGERVSEFTRQFHHWETGDASGKILRELGILSR